MDTAGDVAVLAHPVDVGRVEVEGLARAMAELARRAAEHEPLLDQLALDHRDRAARDVVVVEAGVVAVRPGDHPDVDVLVAPELLEVALARVVAHQRRQRLRLGGDARRRARAARRDRDRSLGNRRGGREVVLRSWEMVRCEPGRRSGEGSDWATERVADHRRESAGVACPVEGPHETSASRRCEAPKAPTGRGARERRPMSTRNGTSRPAVGEDLTGEEDGSCARSRESTGRPRRPT